MMKTKDKFTLEWCVKHENWFQYNCPDCMVDANENSIKEEGRREVVEFIDNLIIGIEGCKFEERFDGDKGCIVLDMNKNQWKAQKKGWGV